MFLAFPLNTMPVFELLGSNTIPSVEFPILKVELIDAVPITSKLEEILALTITILLSPKVRVGSVPPVRLYVQTIEASDEPSDQVRLLINSVGSKSRVPVVLSMAKPPVRLV